MLKKKVISLGFSGIVFFVLAIAISIKGSCTFKYFCNRPHDDLIVFLFSPFVLLFLFSLITYKMREESFQAWWKLARVWVPASMLAIIIAPSYASSWLFPIEKGNVAVFLSLGFFIASALLLISNSYLSGKGKILSAGHIFIIAGFSLFASLALLITLARVL